MDKQIVFKQLLATMKEIYDKPLSEQAQDIWWTMLKPYSAEELSSAMHSHLKDPEGGRFAPKPADLIGKIEGTAKQKSISVEAQALAAWEVVYKSIVCGTPYDSLQLEDKLALAAIKAMGGWTHLCRMREDEAQWKKKEFISNYTTLHGSNNLPERLSGIGQKSHDKLEAQSALANIHKQLNK